MTSMRGMRGLLNSGIRSQSGSRATLAFATPKSQDGGRGGFAAGSVAGGVLEMGHGYESMGSSSTSGIADKG